MKPFVLCLKENAPLPREAQENTSAEAEERDPGAMARPFTYSRATAEVEIRRIPWFSWRFAFFGFECCVRSTLFLYT
jgi:hypothetical protein